jgi:hypothetical protein
MTGLAASIVRHWVRLYTVGLETNMRERIRQEVEADLWEQANSLDASNKPIRAALIIILRWILGIPADVQRIIEESGSGGFSMRTRKFLGVVKQRGTWLYLLIVLSFSVSMLFLGIGSFVIAGIVYIVYKTRQSRRLTQTLLKQ